MIRPAVEADGRAIAAVARANGQPDGADARYVEHLRRRGTLLVAETAGADARVIGFGATLDVGGATMLTDLFVDPERHGGGAGGALLDALPGVDCTFASQDPRAVALYLRAGLTPWWPLLYLHGSPESLPRPPLTVTRCTSAEAAFVEAGMTGVNREADLALLGTDGLIVTRDGEPVAAGVGDLAHLVCRDPGAAADALLATRPHRLCVPGPHPAVPALLEAGYRITGFDVYMASRPDLLPTTRVYSPGLA